jgi:PST family polysaccharide transporter
MRFGSSVVIDIVALTVATLIAIAMALGGCGYWALVSPTVMLPLATTFGLWLATGWIPGLPRRGTGVRSVLYFGGTMTLNGLVSATTGNLDKLLLGRFWGAEALGLYGRAFHLIWFPSDNLNVTIGEVAFAALSRTKDDPQRCKRYFLKGYALVVALTMPLAIICALFGEDVVAVALGSKWSAAADIFRILAPTMMVLAICNPIVWLMNALGLVKRSLYISLVSAPITIAGLALGLPYGPKGVAVAYSAIMMVKLIPHAWGLHSTGVRLSEILAPIGGPLASGLAAAGISYAGHVLYGPGLPLLLRLGADIASFGSVYLLLLLFVARQGAFYLDVIRDARASRSRVEALLEPRP